jgi:VanZ family protein
MARIFQAAIVLWMVDRTFLRLLGWAGILGIAVVSLVPGEFRPHSGMSAHFEHFTAYGLTAAVLAQAYAGRVGAVTLLACLTIYAGVLESAQLWIPGRHAAISDFAVSSLGILTGIAFITLIERIFRRRN